jgi:formylmethanofuran dehydrogenase subunit E
MEQPTNDPRLETLAPLLEKSAAMHQHLCPRQVIGVRMGLLAGELLGLALPQVGKRLHVFAETDGCFVDGVSVATGCWVGRRTLHVLDFGKTAATFVDSKTGKAVRLRPRLTVREDSQPYAPGAPTRWHGYLLAYQVMPLDELLEAQLVTLTVSLEAIISREGMRAVCAACAEEIINAREVERDGVVLCRACAGEGYYRESRAENPAEQAGIWAPATSHVPRA